MLIAAIAKGRPINLHSPERKHRAAVLLGAPGTGKGTHGRAIGTLPGFHHCACGDVFRSMDLDSEVGRVFREYSSRGDLVPDEFTVRLWRDYIRGMELLGRFNPSRDLLVLDGIPRSARQAALLDDAVEVVAVINLVCSDLSSLVARMRSRALHSNRLDDASESVIRHRLEVYQRETAPVLAHFDPGIIVDVDASQSPLNVLADTAASIAERTSAVPA